MAQSYPLCKLPLASCLPDHCMVLWNWGLLFGAHTSSFWGSIPRTSGYEWEPKETQQPTVYKAVVKSGRAGTQGIRGQKELVTGRLPPTTASSRSTSVQSPSLAYGSSRAATSLSTLNPVLQPESGASLCHLFPRIPKLPGTPSSDASPSP